jgi:hypothetical protein
MTPLQDRFLHVYTPPSYRAPLGRVAQGVFVLLVLVIGGVDLASQLEAPIAPGSATHAAILFWEATSMVSALATLWLMWPWLREIHSRAFDKVRRWTAIVGLGLAAAALHILGFKLLRAGGAAVLGPAFVCPVFGKLPYEFAKDVVFFGAFVGGLFLGPASLRRAVFEPPPARPAPVLVQSRPDLLDLPDGRSRQRLRSSDIVAVSSAGNYAEFRLVGGRRPLLRATLARLEAQLAGHGFLRVHRSWIVNPAHVRHIRPQPSGDFQLILEGGETIPASRRYGGAMAGLIEAAETLGGRHCETA